MKTYLVKVVEEVSTFDMLARDFNIDGSISYEGLVGGIPSFSVAIVVVQRFWL